jgi:Protein kinase domain/SPOR domain
MPMNQTSPNSLKAGDVVARRYVILRHLRDEPCGDVWLAQDRALGVDVGLKFMPRRSPTFEAVREALRREGALALKLRHPHILQAIHFEEGEEGVYLIQEPSQGETLLAHLNRLERFRLPYALNLLEQVSKALAYAHQYHEVHHALDPANLLIEDDTVKLTNFTCPPQEEEEPQVTRLELRAYVAPEVIQGDPVTPAANVFSLGVLGFRLTAGSLPYSLTFDEAVPYRLEKMPADLEEIPLPLQNLLLQCLAPDPRDRFEDAGVFLAALEQRRESWRTPSYGKWIGWNPGIHQQAAGVMESVSRICGQFWEGSKGAAGRITEGIQSLREHDETGMARRLLIGVTGAVLALTLLVWGGRTLLRKTGTPPVPALSTAAPSAPETPAASEVKPPPAGVPPLKAAAEPAPVPRAPVAPTPAATPAAHKETKAPTLATKDHYQLWVATYRDYGDALVLKKKIQAKNIPVKVYRGAAEKKVYFAVKAGPFTSKKQAEDVASRLKSGLHLSQTPKLVKIQTDTPKPKTSLSKSHR